MKTCPKEEILQAYLDGELTAQVSDEIGAHLVACAPCAAAVQEMEQAFAVMNSVFAVDLPDAVPTARLRVRIASALAEQAAPRFAWAQFFWRFGWAAAVLLLAGIVGWALLGTHSIKQPQQAHNETPKPVVTPATKPPLPPALERPPELAQQTSRQRHRVWHRAINNKPEEAEVVTAFYPLREGDDRTALESMRLVRVELPGSSLGEVGLPVAPGTANTPVKADVVLGEDGLARAIRFVR